MNRWQQTSHLVGRFLRSLSRSAPDPDEVAWLESKLNPAELDQFSAMSLPDRRHAIGCAVTAAELLGPAATDELVVASALHDVGKTDAGLGTLSRVFATVLIRFLSPSVVAAWSEESGWRRSVARYADHARRGADLLEAGGSAHAVVLWAREHHFEPSEWTLAEDVSAALAEADLVS